MLKTEKKEKKINILIRTFFPLRKEVFCMGIALRRVSTC